MLRTPQPKEQARLLVTLLGQQGLALQHQKALDIVAKLHGHRNWNVMQAEPASVPPAPELPQWLEQLTAAAQAVVINADNSGCSDDLTVTSAQAVQDLDEALDVARGKATAQPAAASPYTVAGFNVEDVLSVRPDLTDDEALGVLQFCDKYYDASYGLNWDRLLDNSHQWMGSAYAVEGVLEYADGRREPVVVELYRGRLLAGTLAGLALARQERRFESTSFGPLPAGTSLKLADGKVEVDMSDEADVYGASSDDLRELCDELRAAGVTFGRMPR